MMLRHVTVVLCSSMTMKYPDLCQVAKKTGVGGGGGGREGTEFRKKGGENFRLSLFLYAESKQQEV